MPLFKIHDGRSAFWQWDLNRRLEVSDDVCGEIHFCNGTSDCSLVCQIYELDGKRVVNVPNILLQTARNFSVYAYVKAADGGYTKRAAIFPVRPRTKPADYVYTETEAKTWEQLAERIRVLEEGGTLSEEDIARALEAYLAEHPIEGGATAEQAAQIEANTAAIEEINKQDYASKAYALQQAENAYNSACQYTQLAVQQVAQSAEQVLAGYYNKGQTEAAIAAAVKGIKVPAKISELDNDAGYQTTAQVTAIVQRELGVIENGVY